uniref:Reverse transcriptase domain-containing protein n=1 Tax=Astyanax mexicanus TaxID=7994 RepID=A0A3B1JAJ2_ASTMX
MRCLEEEQAPQRTGTQPDETQEEPGPEIPHRARNLQVPQPIPRDRLPETGVQTSGDLPERIQIKWPQACKTAVWQQFDEDANSVLDATAKGDADRRLQTMTTIIVRLAVERFGVVEKRIGGAPFTMNQRAAKIHRIRQELKSLKLQFKEASEEQRPPLVELRTILRKKLLTLRRAEWHRRRRKERTRKRASFIANPFGFTKQLLGQRRGGRLACSKEEIDRHIQTTYSDPARQQDLGQCNTLIQPPPPTKEFDGREPLLKEVQDVVKKARSSSAPGPSGVPYKVYKNCPLLLERLWKILKVIWRRGKVARQWRFAEGVWIPKEEVSKNIDQFRIISLLSVEGKIFFSILARRLTDFLSSNHYIDTSVQKGGIPGVPGCLEHTGVVTQLIREARENKGDLAVLWLDLANAYGSIPHKLVQTTLERHHVPGQVAELIMNYYDQFSMRVSTGSITSEWHRVEVGIITGCTISVILFVLAMNMLVKSAETQCRGPKTMTGVRQPPVRAFMDDLTITTESVPGSRWILQGLEELCGWARMRFKPEKSRSLVLKRGKVVDKFRFSIGGASIPTVSEKPVKSLGKEFNSSLKDSVSVQGTCQELESWLRAVDRSGLPGKFKAWIYQHGILPRVLWPLLVYEVPISIVEGLERKVSSFLRRWLGLPRSLSSIALYGRNTKLQLPLRSLEEEFKVTRAREVMMYRDSSDPKVAQAGVRVKTGRKWVADEAVLQAESRIRHRALVGAVTRGRAGLGTFSTPQYEKVKGKERHRLVQEEVRAEVEERRISRAVGLRQQGAWTRWEQAMDRKVTWSELWRAEPQRIKFLVQAVYDILPSPSNLSIWGKTESPNCPQCPGRGTLEHILSCCPVALGQGRYTWRHNQVLRPIAEAISMGISSSKRSHSTTQMIAFVKAGERLGKTTGARNPAGLLATAKDWQLSVDLEKQLKFPQHIVATTLRPDILLVSEETKNILLIELTVPWEDRLDEAHERKRTKYEELVIDCRKQGWKAKCMPIEVGCRGFAGQSLYKTLSALGITGMERRRAIKKIMEEAEKASRWLWIRRSDPWSSSKCHLNTSRV